MAELEDEYRDERDRAAAARIFGSWKRRQGRRLTRVEEQALEPGPLAQTSRSYDLFKWRRHDGR